MAEQDRRTPRTGTRYFEVQLRYDGRNLKLKVRHPDCFAEDVWHYIRHCNTEATQPVASLLEKLVNDSAYMIEIAPVLRDAYYDYVFHEDGWLSAANLTPTRNGKLDNLDVVTDLHKHGKLNAAFDPSLWQGREAEALDVFRTLDRYLPGAWLDETRVCHLPCLELAAGIAPGGLAGRIASEQFSRPGR